jgi:hypothetical protein
MASGEPPDRADVARLWDAETGTLLREWNFGYGTAPFLPDATNSSYYPRATASSAGLRFANR